MQDLYRRALEGRQLQFMVTDGWAGLAAALQTIYPRVAHQRCWVHKMRNLFGAVRRRDQPAVKADAQAIYPAYSPEARGPLRATGERGVQDRRLGSHGPRGWSPADGDGDLV